MRDYIARVLLPSPTPLNVANAMQGSRAGTDWRKGTKTEEREETKQRKKSFDG